MAEFEISAAKTRDGVRVVAGDPLSPVFVPRLNISKWEDEVALTVEYIGAEFQGPRALSIKDGVHRADNNLAAVAIYEKPSGHEFEIILKRKPKTNVFPFRLEARGLRFAYQPPLTEEWKVGDRHAPDGRKVGAVSETWVLDTKGEPLFHRPENVVGSWAVYHAAKKDDFSKVGGRNYGTGKVCHIYRPELIDAEGSRAWAELAVDTAAGQLTITAPQDFLDKAVYPVMVDPTFGESGYGAGEDYLTQAYIYGRLLACPEAGTVTSISAHAGTQSGSGNLQLGVYDSQATPARVDYTGSQAITTTVDWITGNGILGGTLAAANYWLCGNSDVAWKLSCDTGSGGDSNYVGQTFGTWPTSLTGWTDANTYDYSFYCTYTTGPAGYMIAADGGSYALAGTAAGLTYGAAAPWLFGTASTPADNGTNTTTPVVVTPPSGMMAGDLVFVTVVNGTSSGTVAVSQAGGQSWTSLTQQNVTNCRTRSFWCVFNGTWSANPSFSGRTGTYALSARMLVFRPKNGAAASWVVDAAESSSTYTAPGSPYTVTIPSITTTVNGALVIATWSAADDNTWGSLAGSTHTWTSVSPAQVRCTSSANGSMTNAWMIDATAGATGTVSQNQATLGGDAGTYCIIAFREVVNYTLSADSGSYATTGTDAGALAGRKVTADAGAYGLVGSDLWPPVDNCDMYLDFRSGSDGDLMTDALASGGCWPASPPATPVVYPSSPASVLAIETDAASPDLEGTLACGGVEHDLADVVQGMRISHAGTASEEVRIVPPSSTIPICSVGFAFKTTLNAALYEQYGQSGIQGIADADWAILSTYIDASGNVHACIETNGALWPSTPANGPTLAADTWYWVTIQYNRTLAKAYLRVYLLSTRALVGSEIEADLVASPPYVWCVDHGLVASEGNTDDGAFSYYGPFMVDWTDGTFPLLPTQELVNYTLACDGTSYAMTGTDAGTLRGAKTDAEAGVYSLAGQDLSALYGRLLAAEPGALGISGDDVAALYGRLIAAEAGIYTLTGQDVAALFGRLLAAESGSYELTGQDIAALFGRLIAAAEGAYVLSVQDVALVYVPGATTYAITAEGGVYSLSGQDAAVLRAALLAAEAGTYALTGPDLALLRAARIAIEVGAYDLAGALSDLLYGRLLEAGAGSYDLAGQAAGTIMAFRIPADVGAFSIAGQEAALLYTPIGSYILAAEGGAYAIEGADEGLLRAARLSAEGGAYVLEGQAAAALLGRLISAGVGIYALSDEAAALVHGYRLLIEAGEINVAGLDAAVLRDALLAVDPGAVVVAGGDASLPLGTAATLDVGPRHRNPYIGTRQKYSGLRSPFGGQKTRYES